MTWTAMEEKSFPFILHCSQWYNFPRAIMTACLLFSLKEARLPLLIQSMAFIL